MNHTEGRDSYERFALSLWENIKGQVRWFFPWTLPVGMLWYMAFSAPTSLQWVTLPVAGWLTYCLREKLNKL